jgi:hypothetical protein
MAFRISVDVLGTLDMGKDEASAVANLLIRGCDTDTAYKSAVTLGGKAYADLLTDIPADAVVEVWEKPEGKTDEKIRARFTMGAFVARLLVAYAQKERDGDVFEYEAKTTTTKTVEASKPIGSWVKKTESPAS